MKNYEYVMDKLVEIDACTNVLKVKGEIRPATTFAMMFIDEPRYVPQSRCWFYYDGKRWIKDTGDIYVNKLCKVLAEKLKQYCSSFVPVDDTEAFNSANKWQKRSFRDVIIRDARDVEPLDISDFDRNKELINLNNGTFDLSKGILREHNPKDFITKLAPVDYVEGLTSERWEKFIDEIMCEDKDMASYLQRVLGYGISGKTNEEAMFILYGEITRNGKGTLMESVLNVIGDYGKTVKPETIATRFNNPSGPNEDLARLKGVRLASLNEPPKSMKLNSALVKTLTGGDTINARFLHENSFDFVPEFKMYVSTNYLPDINDEMVFRSGRIKVIPFLRHFSPDEQDKSLKAFFKTSEQMSAILGWLICGYYLAQTDFAPPKAVSKAIADYHQESDPVYKFFSTMLLESPASRTPTSEVYKYYYDWALANGKEILPNRAFISSMKRFVKIKKCRVGSETINCFNGYVIRSKPNVALVDDVDRKFR